MIELPNRMDDHGIEARVLLAECRVPSEPGYKLGDATLCMQLMDVVLWKRVNDPKPFLAKAGTLLAVVKARGQFAGFEDYPHYGHAIIHRIQMMLDLANNAKDPRNESYVKHVNAAIQVAQSDSFTDPCPTLAGWRTSGRGTPGGEFTLYKTVLGIDFYSRS